MDKVNCLKNSHITKTMIDKLNPYFLKSPQHSIIYKLADHDENDRFAKFNFNSSQ